MKSPQVGRMSTLKKMSPTPCTKRAASDSRSHRTLAHNAKTRSRFTLETKMPAMMPHVCEMVARRAKLVVNARFS